MKRLIGTVLVASCAMLAAGCGESPEDQARKAGEQIGNDLASIRTADSAQDVGKALDEINAEMAQVKEDLPKGIGEQLTVIQEEFAANAQAATDRAGFRSAYLEAASQLNDLASDTNSVVNEFRRGVREGIND